MNLPQEANGPKGFESICLLSGFGPEVLRKPTANCDFPGVQTPAPSPSTM